MFRARGQDPTEGEENGSGMPPRIPTFMSDRATSEFVEIKRRITVMENDIREIKANQQEILELLKTITIATTSTSKLQTTTKYK